MGIIDAHVHVGNNRHTKYYSLEELRRDLAEAGVQGAVVFAFPEDMYRVSDSPQSRIRANEYVLEVAETSEHVYPFYFVWGDYIVPEDLSRYAGIKWHRHPEEPRYDYDDPRCVEILEEIKRLGMPVLLEEEFHETKRFIGENPELKIIIPHMGKLSGGYEEMDVFFEKPNVYFDTSTASLEAIERVLSHVGPERVIFGSDVSGTEEPFHNFPRVELEKLRKLDLDEEEKRRIFSANIEGLIRK
ncbi:MAG: amidohydrolase family protein [Candidatus Geothermarchaeales archaeon]